MRNNIFTSIVLTSALIAGGLSSCDLDRFPTSSVASEQVTSNPSETLSSLIDGAYAQLKTWSDPMHRLGEYAGDNMMIRGSSTDDFYEFITFSRTPDNYRLQNFWDYGYKAIAQASNIIDMIGETEDVALQQAVDYYNMLCNEDMFSIRDIKFQKNIDVAEKVVRSYARNIGTSCPISLITDDVGIDKETMNKYEEVLQRLYILDNVRAWNTNLRSRTTIRTKDVRYFVDPSIATAALGLTPSSLFKDMNYFGFLFESLAIRDLKIYSESINAKLYHYRDKRGRESDAVLVYRNGDFALIEIKLGDDEAIDEAAKNLLKLQEDLIQKPLYLMVITKSRYAYKRDDGVYVVPLATLRD